MFRRALALLVLAAPTLAAGSTLRFTGVLDEFGGLLTCDVIRTDDGELFALSNTGGFQHGDRIVVTASSVSTVVCTQSLLPRLVDNTIAPAFAGIGRIAARGGGGAVLEAPGGGLYALSDDGGLPVGSRVFVAGEVHELRGMLGIDVEAVGPGFAEFGRLDFDAGGWRIETGLRSLPLERMGLPFAQPGDFVWVEGRIAPNPGGASAYHLIAADIAADAPFPLPWRVRDNVISEGFAHAGELVLLDGEPRFRADDLIFHDEFALGDTGEFSVGERLFVRGRSLDDYDPHEDRSEPRIRRASLDVEWSGCGTVLAGGAFLSDEGESFELEYDGGFAPGTSVHVAGALGSPTASLFLFDRILPCAALSGRLEIGFGCTPVFVADEFVPGAGDVFFLEDNGGYALGEPFCVEGAITGCGEGCSVPCLTANVAAPCPPE